MNKTVLFVCVHNSGRSQMAEAFFNHLAKGKAIAVSAGTQPASEINPMAVEVMRESGLDISGNQPKTLTLEMIEKADKMITMGCGADARAICPASFLETEDWALEDPEGKSIAQVRIIRNEIEQRIIRMLDDIDAETVAN